MGGTNTNFDIPSGSVDLGTTTFGVGPTGVKDWSEKLSTPAEPVAKAAEALPEVAPSSRIALSTQTIAAMIPVVEVSGEQACSTELSAPVTEAAEALSQVSAPVATPEGVYVELKDSREGFDPHKAYLFLVEKSQGTVRQELEALLGKEDTDLLAKDWDIRCNLDLSLDATQVALFLDSNKKARNRDYAQPGDKTTQEEDFTATVYEFSSDLAATLLCARKLAKYRTGTPLSDAEQDLKSKLAQGVIRSCSGALVVLDDGRLRADRFLGYRGSDRWALGSPLSPESK